jgi:hypothetical protein
MLSIPLRSSLTLIAYMILGVVLTAIVLPWTVSSPTGPFEQAEIKAQSLIANVTRLQAASYLEDQQFLSDFAAIRDADSDISSRDNIPIINGTSAYDFDIVPIDEQKTMITATATMEHLHSFTGFVWNSQERGLVYGMCQTIAPSQQPPELPELQHQLLIPLPDTSCSFHWLD